ncbi:MAG: xylulokinase [Halieaceae bacterium]|jgi:xylulokinase|nr:xylulokinase [Halieaceae bacterium]
MDTTLGIDLGTQSLKVVFYDYASREVVASASSPLDVMRDATGRAEQEASWWLAALKDALQQVDERVRMSVRAIAVSGQQHGFVPLDGNGDVLHPVKLWCDTSTQQEADEIMEAVGGRERCIELAGNPVLTGYTAPKIRWLKKHYPSKYADMALVLLPHDYLNFVMTDRAAMEYGDASGTALLDVRQRCWSRELLQAVDPARDLANCLPELVAPGDVVGRTSTTFAREFGLPAGVPVAPGGGDNMMAAIGTGNVIPGRLTMSLGTSGTLFAFTDRPIVDPEGNIAAFCSSTGGWLPLLCTMNCTLATELMKRPLSIESAGFDTLIDSVPATSNGLIVLPFFTGERTPNLPRASASVLGLTAENCDKGHLLRATVEGVTYGLRFGLDELRRLGIESSSIVLTGGGANSRSWCQIVADICRLPVLRLAQDEGASFGAALQALWVLERQHESGRTIGDVTREHIVPRPDLACDPDDTNADRYIEGYAAYRHAVADMAHS